MRLIERKQLNEMSFMICRYKAAAYIGMRLFNQHSNQDKKNNNDQTCSCSRDQLRASLKALELHSIMVLRVLRGVLNWDPIMSVSRTADVFFFFIFLSSDFICCYKTIQLRHLLLQNTSVTPFFVTKQLSYGTS